MANVKFFKGDLTNYAKEYEAGGIYFDSASREIRLGNGGTGTAGYTAYGNGIKDAVLADSKLTISFHDTTKSDIVLDFSDIASASGTTIKFKELADKITALEAKIKAEASRADTAEKANAAAAKAAKDAAAAAQATADAKVASVSGETGNAIKVDSTTATAPKVSLVLDPAQGNVKLSQSTAGLKAEVEIPAATVTGVKTGDKVLALNGTELTSTISLSIDATAGEDGKKYIRLKGIGDADLGKIDIADFVKDGMLDSASLATNPEGQPAGTYIVLTWNTDAGKQPMYINVTSLIDTYTAGEGLTLNDHKFAVDYTKVAKKSDLDAVAGKVSTLEGKVGSAKVGETPATGLYKEIADEASTARAAEKKNADAIAAETTRATAAEEKVKSDLIGAAGDTKDSNTIKGAKKYTDSAIADLDVTGNVSAAVAGITVTVNETDGKVIKPVVAVTPGAVAEGNTSVVTGGAVKTYVDTAITNAALTWNEIPA